VVALSLVPTVLISMYLVAAVGHLRVIQTELNADPTIRAIQHCVLSTVSKY